MHKSLATVGADAVFLPSKIEKNPVFFISHLSNNFQFDSIFGPWMCSNKCPHDVLGKQQVGNEKILPIGTC